MAVDPTYTKEMPQTLDYGIIEEREENSIEEYCIIETSRIWTHKHDLSFQTSCYFDLVINYKSNVNEWVGSLQDEESNEFAKWVEHQFKHDDKFKAEVLSFVNKHLKSLVFKGLTEKIKG